MDSDTESDEETQLRELQQLNALLEADDLPSGGCSSRYSSTSVSRVSATNTNISKNKTSDEIHKINKALALSKLTDEKLRKLEGILISRLRECRQKLAEIQSIQNAASSKNEKPNDFRYINCARPYFKDPDGFPPPENDDTITMRESGMYDFSEVTSVAGWTVKDKSDFLKEILKITQVMKKKEILSEIAQLKRDKKVKDSKTIPVQIRQLTKKIDDLKTMVLNEETALPIDQQYDWDMIAANLKDRHSPQEYSALWKLYLHPSINKTKWNKAEHAKLQDIAMANTFQDWDKIAKQLNTGRTGYQCFVYYKTNMNNTVTGQKWTKEEEEYLRRLIDYYREDDYIPWCKVAASMENRTKMQIYNKYLRLTELRKGRFLPEEDAVLLTCIDNFGPEFRRIAKYLPGRSSAQLRTRYHVLRSKTRTSMVWTAEEDKKLIQLMSNQDSSINYSALTEHFPNKNRVQLRARYITLVKWMKKYPNLDISKAPRRGARRLGHGQCSESLNTAIENLKKRIQSEVEIKKVKRISMKSSEDVIEDGIIAALVTEHVRNEEFKKLSDNAEINLNALNNGSAVNETELRKVLILLRAKLNREHFVDSSYWETFRGLSQEEPNFVFKVKSYSRKSQTNRAHTFQINNLTPDIWGERPLTKSDYVFPPNYATLTGCKKLMAYISMPGVDNQSMMLQTMMKKNPALKEYVDIFVQRFCTLFLWPMLLSNEEPHFKPVMCTLTDYNDKIVQQREQLSGITSFLDIPSTSAVRHFVSSTDEPIDLDTSGENEKDNTVITQEYNDEDFGSLSN